MKYYHDLPVPAIIGINRAAWRRKCGGQVDPNNTTQELCHMHLSEDGQEAELHVRPQDEQHFTAAERAKMKDTPTIPIELPPQAGGQE